MMSQKVRIFPSINNKELEIVPLDEDFLLKLANISTIKAIQIPNTFQMIFKSMKTTNRLVNISILFLHFSRFLD